MECKFARLIFVFIFLALFLPALSAQEEEEGENPRYTISAIEPPDADKNYYITRDEKNNIKFIQKLSWNKISDIKNYRITVQKKSEGGWTDILEKDLTENRIEVSLEAGEYRFNVAVVNLFDQLEKTSAWQNFEVLKALQPKIESYESGSLILNSKNADGIFILNGENLSGETKFTMQEKNSDPPRILEGKIISVSPDGKSVQVQFDLTELSEGKYEIYAQNPGGLSVISRTVTIKNKKEREWRLLAGAGYTMPLLLQDGTLEEYLDSKIMALSANLKISVISFCTKAGDFGFALDSFYSRIKADTENYELSGNMASALFMLVWQKYFIPQKLCMEVHGGAGLSALGGVKFTNSYNGAESPSLNSAALAFGGGLGIQYHIWKHFYVEGNIDYIQANFKDMSVGALYPSVGVGVMF